MKLHRKEVVAPDAGAERRGVIGFRGDHVQVARCDIVRVHEIKVLAVFDAIEHGRAAEKLHLVPTHVRHLVLGRHAEAHDAAGHYAKPFVFSILITLVEQ
jgi:hypothetical protein